MADTPTILEWGGGAEAFGQWLNRFYDLVEEEGSLAPLFGGTVSEEHRDHVLVWWVEVMGGPAGYTARLGGYPAMLAHHRGLAITPEQQRIFVTLLSQAADEADLPADPEFRAAIIGYAEWGSRLAMHNSDPDAADVVTEAPSPAGVGASRRHTKAETATRLRRCRSTSSSARGAGRSSRSWSRWMRRAFLVPSAGRSGRGD